MSVATVFAGEPLPTAWDASVYLCGPSEAETRHDRPNSEWRRTAVEALTALWPSDGGELVIFYPEAKGHPLPYADQVVWEETAMAASDVIVFYVPRRMKDLPGLVTNVKWGRFAESGRVLLGAPADAERNEYLLHFARRAGIFAGNSVESTAQAALNMIGRGARREGALTLVPACVYTDPLFADACRRYDLADRDLVSCCCRYTRRETFGLGWRVDFFCDHPARTLHVAKTLGSLVTRTT